MIVSYKECVFNTQEVVCPKCGIKMIQDYTQKQTKNTIIHHFYCPNLKCCDRIAIIESNNQIIEILEETKYLTYEQREDY